MTMPVACTVAAALAAVLLVAITAAGFARIDESWRSHRWTCPDPGCHRTWLSTEKRCRCGRLAVRGVGPLIPQQRGPQRVHETEEVRP